MAGLNTILTFYLYTVNRAYDITCRYKDVTIESLKDVMDMAFEGSDDAEYKAQMITYYNERLKFYRRELDRELG